MEKKSIFKLTTKQVVAIGIGAALYAGDVIVYGEPAGKVWFQIIMANVANLIVVAVIGIPVVIAITKLKGKTTELEEE